MADAACQDRFAGCKTGGLISARFLGENRNEMRLWGSAIMRQLKQRQGCFIARIYCQRSFSPKKIKDCLVKRVSSP
jgi:hypothetical protein